MVTKSYDIDFDKIGAPVLRW